VLLLYNRYNYMVVIIASNGVHCQESDAKGPDKKKAKKGGGGAPGKRPK